MSFCYGGDRSSIFAHHIFADSHFWTCLAGIFYTVADIHTCDFSILEIVIKGGNMAVMYVIGVGVAIV